MYPATTAFKKIPRILFSQSTFWVMVGCVASLVFLYIYFVNSIVWHVASRQQTERKLSDLTAQMAAVEAHYVELTSGINIDHAYNLGFKDISDDQTQFVKRSATLGSLTMRQVQ